MNLKLILFYIIGFIILYLEPIPIAGMTFGVLWKTILIIVLFIPIIYQILKTKYIEMFAFIIIVFAFKTLISYSSLDYIINTITIFTKTLMLPMLYLFFILKLKEETLKFLAKHFAILIIVSFLPYMFGILTPLGVGYNLEPYGLVGQHGLVGPFLNPHSASISTAFSMIIITSEIDKKNRKLENFFYILLLLLGFYELLATYVRSGLTIYLLTLIYIYLQNINLKKIFLIILTIGILGMGSIYLISTNEVVQMRFHDVNKYNKSGELGSGRVTFWKTAVESWLNDETCVIFIGLGEEYAKDKMEKATGMRIFAHNEFFQTLQQEGLIGFILFILYLYLIYIFIEKHKNSPYYLSAKVIFIGLFIEMMLQGGFYFNIVFFLSIYLALLKLEYLSNINLKKVKVKNNVNK